MKVEVFTMNKTISRSLLLLLLIAAAAVFLCTRPKTYEGMGELLYTDPDGSFQLLTSDLPDRFSPRLTIANEAGSEDFYRFPLRLYINRQDTGDNAKDTFMEKVSSAEIEADQPSDSESPVTASQPEFMDFSPESALVSLVDYTMQSPSLVTLTWVLHMQNGDTLRLGTELSIIPVYTHYYDSDSADLSDAAALQALIDRLAAEIPARDIVNIQLPAATYTEPIVLHSRMFNLNGSEKDGKRTAFTAGIQMRKLPVNYGISYLTGIDFTGDGSGIALSAADRVWTKECRFTNWKTAFLIHGGAWGNTTDCEFTNNAVGLHYNTDTGASASDSRFTGNIYTDNSTAVLLERVPTSFELDFSGCVFTGNETDIDNRCEQPLNVSEAVFQ